MDIFTLLLLVVCTLFGIYKIIYKLISKYLIKKRENVHIALKSIKKEQVDLQYYSTPSFNFPNVQSEADMKILNSGPDICEKQGEIDVKQYCKY